MGRRELKSTNWAYIAGFLDGDGSIMVQLKRRKESPIGIRLMFTICFYQDSRHKKPLTWMKNFIGIGYLSDRNDGISELRINGYRQVERVLRSVQPYAKFKAKQVEIVLRILGIINNRRITQLSKEERKEIVGLIILLKNQNYFSSQRKNDKEKLNKFLAF